MENPLAGNWAYRSFYNDPDLNKSTDSILLGSGTLEIKDARLQVLTGVIGGDGWSLDLQGARSYGDPMSAWFTGTGVVDGSQWQYDYICYLVPHWPIGKDQVPALVGSVVRAIPHPGGGDSIHPAGVVGSWFAPLIAR